MDPLRIIVLILHISAAAILIGAPLGVGRNLKSALKLGRLAFQNATEDAVRRGTMAGVSSLLTLATGLALIFMAGGMGAVPINFHMALGLMILALGLNGGLVRPTMGKLANLAKADPIDQDRALGLIKRLAIGAGIQHLLWVIILTLMFVRIYK